MVTLAVVPARGGSKRIHKKNIAEFHGRPLVSWTISAALESESVDEVLISTDDEEIEAVAVGAGARSLGLRRELADDQAPSSLVSRYELDRFVAATGQEVRTVVQLLPTCPLRTFRRVDEIVQAHSELPSRPRISAHAPIGGSLWWAATLDGGGSPSFLHPDALAARSQDLPEAFVPNGAVWVTSSSELRRHGTFYSPGFVFHAIPWEAGFDIDTPKELELARLLAPNVLQCPE